MSPTRSGVRVEEQDPLGVDDLEPAVVRRRESAVLRREHSNLGKLPPHEIYGVVRGAAVHHDNVQVDGPGDREDARQARPAASRRCCARR